MSGENTYRFVMVTKDMFMLEDNNSYYILIF